MDLSLERTLLPPDTVKRHIVAAALRVGAQVGSWDKVHVHEVAREAGVTLQELSHHFGDKDAIAEGFFDLADARVRALPQQPSWRALPVQARLERVIWTWLETLAPYRALAGEMLRYKMHPEHLHLQARGVMRVSRTVQWMRETVMLQSVGWRREVEEAGLTSIYLATLGCWLSDRTAGSERTLGLLRRLLGRADRAAAWLALGR